GRYSARNLAPKDACALIEMSVAQVLSRDKNEWPQPYKPTSPVTFKVDLAAPDGVNDFKGRSGVEIAGPRTVLSTGNTFWEAWDQFWYRN
ncbi:MAG TPA: M55 family metallopeptidase, partial [Ktedonobacteraceae bacterium]|nr:M55 family metallopeptidase [Ktedonobacteraceae bacterium]